MFRKFQWINLARSAFRSTKVFIILKWGQMVWKFPGKVSRKSKNFRKANRWKGNSGKEISENFGIPRKVGLCRKLRKIVVHSSVKTSRDTNRIILSNKKRPRLSFLFKFREMLFHSPLEISEIVQTIIFGRMGSVHFYLIVFMCVHDIYVGSWWTSQNMPAPFHHHLLMLFSVPVS